MSAPRRRRARRTWALAAIGLMACASLAGAQRMRGPERKLVALFDKDGDKRLNRTERAAARSLVGDSYGGGGWRRRGLSAGSAGIKLAPGKALTVPVSKGFYDPGALRTVFLQFENDDWEDELVAFYNTDVEVPATMTVDGVVFKDVGVHFRGLSSFGWVSDGSKRSLNLDMNFVHKGQRLLGYTSFNFLNALNDPSFMRTVIYSQIARDYIAAPKVNFIRTAINGQDWGIYLNAQQFNRDFLREFFPGKDDGARWHAPGRPWGSAGLEYVGDDPAAYRASFEIKTKDDPQSWARLIQLTRVLNQTPERQLEAALAPLLDIDGALKFLAIEVVLSNSDGYWARASDYNLYLDSDGRFHIIPHDFNEAMLDNTDLDPLVSVDDEFKPLRSKLLAVPALRARYLRHVKDIAEKWLDWRRIGPIIEAHQALIGDEVAIDKRKLYSTADFRTSAADLKDWIEARRSFLLR